jgi:hypothetical protein
MAQFKARQDVVVAGKAHAAGKTFEAEPEAVRGRGPVAGRAHDKRGASS